MKSGHYIEMLWKRKIINIKGKINLHQIKAQTGAGNGYRN